MATFQPYEEGGVVGPKQKGIIELLQGAGGQGVNEAAGYDVGKWNGLPAAEQAKYIAQGGAPTLPGPTPPIGASEFPGAWAASPAQPPSLDFGRLAGYDQGKFDSNKQDAKYQMGRVLAGFDPTQGVTPEVLTALNGLGYGNFSGSGQHLSLSGLTDKGRQNKLSGDYQNADVIQGFSGGHGKWQHSDPIAEAAQSQPQQRQMGGGGMPSLSGISPMLQSDALGNVQQALSSLEQPGMLQQLIAALQGGR